MRVDRRLGELLAFACRLILQPRDIKVVFALGDRLARELPEPSLPALVLARLERLRTAQRVRTERLYKRVKIITRQWRSLAERRGVRPQVMDPDFLGVALVTLPSSKEQHVGLY